jgi:hypothetical protein
MMLINMNEVLPPKTRLQITASVVKEWLARNWFAVGSDAVQAALSTPQDSVLPLKPGEAPILLPNKPKNGVQFSPAEKERIEREARAGMTTKFFG